MRLRACLRVLLIVLSVGQLYAGAGRAVPPVEVTWFVHVGPLGPGETYEDVCRERDALIALARQAGARATLLVTGDVAEEALARGHGDDWKRLQREGFEIGTRVAATTRLGTRSWRPAAGATRFGARGYDAALARRMWSEHALWVDRLAGAQANRAVDAEPFVPSQEEELATAHHLDVSTCRAGKFTELTDDLAPGPWRPAASDAPGTEIDPVPGTGMRGLVELDRLGQLGDPFEILGDASVFMAREALVRRAAGADGFRTFGFLTRASPAARPLWPEVVRFVRWVGRECTAPPDGDAPRRARWATASGARTAYLAWEAFRKQAPQLAPAPARAPAVRAALDPLALRTRAAHLAAITRLRAEHARTATSVANIELRWWALTLWRRAQESIDPLATEAAFPRAEQARLAARLADGYTVDLSQTLDGICDRLEAASRKAPRR